MKQLKSFVHVSTLYTHCNKSYIEEKVYENSLNYHDLIHFSQAFKNFDPKKVEEILLQNLPNTYTLTKQVAEDLTNHQTFYLPSGIFRPAVGQYFSRKFACNFIFRSFNRLLFLLVFPVYKDPLPGFVDNVNGPSGICVGVARGFIHCIYGNKHNKSNIVPVDYCINALIASAWDVYTNYESRIKQDINIPVYNYAYNENNLTWQKFMSLSALGLHEPLEKFIW